MAVTSQQVAAAVASEAGSELDSAVRKIQHCLNQLTDEQIWLRPTPSTNSIANLILHICGNARQWIIAGIGGAEDTRNRPKEFSERSSLSKEQLLERLVATVSDAKAALVGASPEDFLEPRTIQGFVVSGMQATFESVAHFRGHTQEIVHMTRSLLGDDYQFDFVPATPEQGAE